MEMLYSNDPQIADKLIAAIVAEPGDTIRITTPQFTRTDGVQPAPSDASVFETLRGASKDTLLTAGLQQWGDYGLWLFPGEWFNLIPKGYEVMCISGVVTSWNVATHDDDTRFGALAYGIVPDFEKSASNSNQ